MKLIKYLCCALLLISSNTIKAQEFPEYTVDLDNEMHYKIHPEDWQNRGVKEFTEDIKVLFRDVQFENYISSKSLLIIFYEVNFTNEGNPELSLFGTTFPERNDFFENILKNKLLGMIYHFKPARYKGKIIPKSYRVNFTIRSSDNKTFIYNVEFESTLSFNNAQTSCFTVYSKAKNNYPDDIFLAMEIEPEYRGGFNNLCFDLNRKLNLKE